MERREGGKKGGRKGGRVAASEAAASAWKGGERPEMEPMARQKAGARSGKSEKFWWRVPFT